MSGPWDASVFLLHSLVFQVPSGTYTTDALGQQVPATSAVTVVAKLRATNDPALREQAGADAESVALIGRLQDPTAMPAGIVPGMTASLTVDGRPGVFTLARGWPASIPAVEAALGARIVGRWDAR